MSLPFDPIHGMPPEDPEPASLLEMPLRVWVEIGRARMPAASVVGMTRGTIVDLDCDPDAPADIYVNGRHFGTGKVILVDGEWALRVETLDDLADELDDELEQPSSDDQPAAQPSE
jgi:flagellar motor switch protein FliN/FliY